MWDTLEGGDKIAEIASTEKIKKKRTWGLLLLICQKLKVILPLDLISFCHLATVFQITFRDIPVKPTGVHVLTFYPSKEVLQQIQVRFVELLEFLRVLGELTPFPHSVNSVWCFLVLVGNFCWQNVTQVFFFIKDHTQERIRDSNKHMDINTFSFEVKPLEVITLV